MTERDRAVLEARPTVDAHPELASTDLEAFLHRTLRPVLKLQNDVLLALVANDVAKRVPGFASLGLEVQRDRLTAMLKTDSRLKRVLVGVVWGSLTTDELTFALEAEGEVRRRVMALLVERVASQTETVVGLVQARAER
ncbi:hypothetical protein [Rubrivirga sp.]|uniref:hypothetical protein n=1 Tax=Rubrivirga sp. TaxID=1885344 RepID=UPI003C731915